MKGWESALMFVLAVFGAASIANWLHPSNWLFYLAMFLPVYLMIRIHGDK